MQRTKKKTRDGVFTYTTKRGGRWGVDYRDPATKERKRRAGFETKKAALQWKNKLECQTLGITPTEDPSLFFSIAVDRYISHRLAQGKTLGSYYHLVLRSKKGMRPGFWTIALGTMRIAEITTEQVETILEHAVKQRRWSRATRNRALAQLSGLLSYAYARRWIAVHPVDRGRIPRLAEDNARTRWLRLHEVDAIADHSPGWLRSIIKFAVATGMRLGEICSLTRASFQCDAKGRGFVVTERTKNGERLAWPLEGWALEYVERRVADTEFPGEYLFPAPKGGNAYTAVQAVLRGVVEAAGLRYGRKHKDGVTFHTFRHSMASLALNHGIPESVVQRMGNWKSRSMLSRYAHLADESLRNAAAKLVHLVEDDRQRRGRGRKSKDNDRSCVESA